MNRKRIKAIALIVATLGVLLFIFGAKHIAVAKLKITVGTRLLLSSSEDIDYFDNESRFLYLNSEETLHSLQTVLASGHLEVKEVTGLKLDAWPTPIYYIGNVRVGGDHCFSVHILFRTFHIHLPDGKQARDFWNQIDSIR